jgi:hypothetical protein
MRLIVGCALFLSTFTAVASLSTICTEDELQVCDLFSSDGRRLMSEFFSPLTCFHWSPRNVQLALGANVSVVARQQMEE